VLDDDLTRIRNSGDDLAFADDRLRESPPIGRDPWSGAVAAATDVVGRMDGMSDGV
jgi:hypothetical protein